MSPMTAEEIDRAAKAMAERWVREAAQLAQERNPHAGPTELNSSMLALLAKKVALLAISQDLGSL